jgi:hypothetical protein
MVNRLLNPREISKTYPRLYHMAEQGSWLSIRKYGLLSTSALLDLYGIKGKERYTIECEQRRKSVRISHPIYGSAVIRDQIPLPEKALKNFVDGMSTADYYKLLNLKTFFWVRKERLQSLLRGRAYKARPHSVLTLDTEILVSRHEEAIWLSRINSGAFFGSGRRGAGTFKRINEYPFEEMKKKQKEDAIVELAVDYCVKDVDELVIRVENWVEDKPMEVIWERK